MKADLKKQESRQNKRQCGTAYSSSEEEKKEIEHSSPGYSIEAELNPIQLKALLESEKNSMHSQKGDVGLIKLKQLSTMEE